MSVLVLVAMGVLFAVALGIAAAEGLLKRPLYALVAALVLAAAFFMRWRGLDMLSGDYLECLSPWVEYFRANGGFAALSDPPGNYNMPYLYFLAACSYLNASPLFLIKLSSVAFDIFLAWTAMKLVGHLTGDPLKMLLCYCAVLFWPTVLLNGAYWGQCDSVYAAFALLSVWLGLKRKPALAMICIGICFSLKLQAVFIMPFFVALWFTKRVKWYHFLLFPLTYLVLMLPAVLMGYPVSDAVTFYLKALDSTGNVLNYNSASVFGFVSEPRVFSPGWSKVGIAAAFVFMSAVLAVVWFRRKAAGDMALFGVAVLLCMGIPYLLPNMHDRYFYLAEVITLILAFCRPPLLVSAFAAELGSLNCYWMYITPTALFSTGVSAACMLVALAAAGVFAARELFPHGRPRVVYSTEKSS